MSPTPRVRIFAKLEGLNPSGSIKDRVVLALIRDAEASGRLSPGAMIVEASSGNTAISLAMIGRHLGYRVKVVVPTEAVPSIADLIDLYGAEMEWAEPAVGMTGAIARAKTIADEQGAFYLGQFESPANVEVHYSGTGAEILTQLPRVDAFVAGMGTCGTLMGVGRRLREANPNVRVVGVEPRLGEKLQGLRSLGEGFTPPLLDLSAMDRRYLVDSATAIDWARRVIGREGVMAGMSSGATTHAACRLAEEMDEGVIVAMFADSGWKYLPARPWAAAEKGDESLDDTYWW